MENLAPVLGLALHLRFDLQQGISLYDSLQAFCDENEGEFSKFLRMSVYKIEQGSSIKLPDYQLSRYGHALFELIEQGLNGVAVTERLYQLEVLMVEECRRNIEELSLVLPYKGLVPLMLFMFPALILLILTPILGEFLEVLQ